MYSGDVPAILSARKTYSFRGIELTPPLSSLAGSTGFATAAAITTPMSASRPLIRLRDNPRRRRELLCFFLLPHSTWNISTHPGISRFTECLFGWNPARFLSTERRKYTIFMWFDEYILMLTVVEQVWEEKFFFNEKNKLFSNEWITIRQIIFQISTCNILQIFSDKCYKTIVYFKFDRVKQNYYYLSVKSGLYTFWRNSWSEFKKGDTIS